MMRIGLDLAINDSPERFGRVVRAVERGGFQALWLVDNGLWGRDLFVHLAWAAVLTRHVWLGPGVTHPLIRHPGVIANTLATLDELSQGRAVLGLSSGGASVVRELGCAPASLAQMRETCRAVRRLLRGEVFRAARRRSPLDDLDLNRTFPGDPAGSPSQRLAYHLLHDYVLQADFVLSLHSWSAPAVVVPYVEFPAGDGAVTGRSLAAARQLGLEFLRGSHWHPGLLVATAIRHGVPAVETEVGGLGISQPVTREGYVEVVLNLLRYLHVVSDAPPPTSPTARIVRHVELAAPVGGPQIRAHSRRPRAAGRPHRNRV